MSAIDPSMRLRRAIPRERPLYVTVAMPIPWSVKNNTGLVEPIPYCFSRGAMTAILSTVKGRASPTGQKAAMKATHGVDYRSPENVIAEGIQPFDVVDLFWRVGAGRNPGNHPIYQALVAMAVARGTGFKDSFSRDEIELLCRSLGLEWGQKRLYFEVDRLLTREHVRPCLLLRDEFTGEFRFPVEKWLDAPIFTDDDILQQKAERHGFSTTRRGPPRGTKIEAALANGPMRTSELLDALDGSMAREAVGVMLTRLKRQGRVEHVERGVWALAVDKHLP